MSLEALQEELTVQKVVLDSLTGSTLEGCEEMRQDAHREIDRLKKLIRSTKQKKQLITRMLFPFYYEPTAFKVLSWSNIVVCSRYSDSTYTGKTR